MITAITIIYVLGASMSLFVSSLLYTKSWPDLINEFARAILWPFFAVSALMKYLERN